MKRLSVIVARGATIAALGVMTTGLAACGGHEDDSAGSAPGAQATSASASAVASSAAAAPSSAATSSAAASSAPVNSKLGPASRTTCATFKNMTIDDETSLVKKVLAENPGSRLDGSPNVALGTAKLVCLASSEQSKPIAVAIGVAQ
ncbi:hypothetical protein [Nocardia miyunensis]|uniref:hypothetical protein n=1 Tax=Nocardia miyunensis TaxID=282684 RepID=UPI00082F051B|nr:hypothetical protein [Nocardia miyunensis]